MWGFEPLSNKNNTTVTKSKVGFYLIGSIKTQKIGERGDQGSYLNTVGFGSQRDA